MRTKDYELTPAVFSLMVLIDNAGPKELKAGAKALADFAAGLENRASRRVIAHDLAKVLEKEAKR